MNTSFLADRAHLGAEYLDTVRPAWAQEIDLDILNLQSTSLCVLGQLFSGYGAALAALSLSFEQEYQLGFHLRFSDIDAVTIEELGTYAAFDRHYGVLTQAWQNEIRDRLATAT